VISNDVSYQTKLLHFLRPPCVSTMERVYIGVAAIQVEGSEYVEATSPIQLTCNATGRPDPPHNVDWHKDGSKVRSDANGGVIITKKIETRVLVSMLVIRRSQESDSGTYVCRSSNGETGTIVVHVLKSMSRTVYISK